MENGYENVRHAILRQAVYDYKRALRKRQGYAIAHYEKWFLSNWGQMLSGGLGSVIIEQCRESVGMKPKTQNANNS